MKPFTKKILSILGIIGLILVNVYIYRYIYQKSDNIANIYIGSHTRKAEIASTEESKITGLMNRPQMDSDKAMIFVREDDKVRNFWMKNTMIPLDIIFIDSGYNVVNIQNGKPYDLSMLSSSGLARYVLEINGGQASQYDISIGDKVQIK